MVRSSRFEAGVIACLMLVMLLTRTHAIGAIVHVPDTSLASFFLLGALVRRPLGFALLFALSVGIDFAVIGWMGQSDYCLTPAYWMMLPAYGVMWGAGRFVAARGGFGLSGLPVTIGALVAATFLSHLFSSGGFYFLGGRFPDASLSGFLPRIERYFPPKLAATLWWGAIGWAGLMIAARRGRSPRGRA